MSLQLILLLLPLALGIKQIQPLGGCQDGMGRDSGWFSNPPNGLGWYSHQECADACLGYKYLSLSTNNEDCKCHDVCVHKPLVEGQKQGIYTFQIEGDCASGDCGVVTKPNLPDAEYELFTHHGGCGYGSGWLRRLNEQITPEQECANQCYPIWHEQDYYFTVGFGHKMCRCSTECDPTGVAQGHIHPSANFGDGDSSYKFVRPTTTTTTTLPTRTPSRSPSSAPVGTPSSTPSSAPVGTPSRTPSSAPVGTPSRTPSSAPVGTPSRTPSSAPVGTPSRTPSSAPVGTPSRTPSSAPVSTPSRTPSSAPVGTIIPSNAPVGTPSSMPIISITTTGTPVSVDNWECAKGWVANNFPSYATNRVHTASDREECWDLIHPEFLDHAIGVVFNTATGECRGLQNTFAIGNDNLDDDWSSSFPDDQDTVIMCKVGVTSTTVEPTTGSPACTDSQSSKICIRPDLSNFVGQQVSRSDCIAQCQADTACIGYSYGIDGTLDDGWCVLCTDGNAVIAHHIRYDFFGCDIDSSTSTVELTTVEPTTTVIPERCFTAVQTCDNCSCHNVNDIKIEDPVRNYGLSTLDDCKQACIDHLACNDFEYGHDAAGESFCVLWSGACSNDPPLDHETLVQYTLVETSCDTAACTDSQSSKICVRPDLSNFVGQQVSRSDCIAQCQADTACIGYSYGIDGTLDDGWCVLCTDGNAVIAHHIRYDFFGCDITSTTSTVEPTTTVIPEANCGGDIFCEAGLTKKDCFDTRDWYKAKVNAGGVQRQEVTDYMSSQYNVDVSHLSLREVRNSLKGYCLAL